MSKINKIGYIAVENTKTGTHSVYAKPVFNRFQPTFDTVCEDACKNTTYEETVMKACVREYMNSVQKYASMGFRVPLGEKFLVIYPTLDLSVKDGKDPSTGETIVATPEMLNSRNAHTRLGCTVNAAFSKEFSGLVSWQRVKPDGTVVADDEEDITQDNSSETTDTSTGTVDTSTNSGSGDDGLGG